MTKTNQETKVGYPGLGEQMQLARKRVGLSQEKMGIALGVSWMTIHRRENGDRAQSFGQFEKFAILCDTTPEGLMSLAVKEFHFGVV